MDITLLETFVKVVQLQNINKAARELHISQPTASARIHSLESMVGYKLFEKAGRGIHLTSAARKLYPYVIHSLNILQSGIKAVEHFDHDRSRCPDLERLSFAAESGFMYTLARLLAFLTHNTNGGIQFDVLELPVDRLRQELEMGSVKLAITRQELYHPAFRTYHLYTEQVKCVVNSKFTQCREASLPLILHASDRSTSTASLQIDRKEATAEGFAPHTSVIYVEQLSTIKELICAGAGCGFLPLSFIQKELDSGQLRIVSTGRNIMDNILFEHANFQVSYPQYLIVSTDLPLNLQQFICSLLSEYDLQAGPS